MSGHKGLIQVYTGEGKGKTTAALGLACRARGRGLKVCYVCFHKEPKKWGYGEQRILKKLGIKVKGLAKKHPRFFSGISTREIRKDCLKGLECIKGIIQKNKYDMLILDEILISLRDGFLKEEEILGILASKPKDLELVLTGRGASQKIIEKADLVSEIKKIKHPYDTGIKGRKGIEF